MERIALKYGTENKEIGNTQKKKKRNSNYNYIKSNQILEYVQKISQNFVFNPTSRALQEAAGVDATKLGGATVFPTDVDASINSLHHPWACSLRSKGFRGRHRCGVTLLSGK